VDVTRPAETGSSEDSGDQKEHQDDAEHAPEPKDLHYLPSSHTSDPRLEAARSTGIEHPLP
jgi:hypothetical protein